MKAEGLSILDTIKKGDIQASLFTTFNANFPYFEDLVLRRLTAAGCLNNVLLVDQRQLSLAYLSDATRPRLAGVGYTLIPIELKGAFHPKLCLLSGKKKSHVFVGSHNLTISGFGYNREVTNQIEIPGLSAIANSPLFASAWSSARGWIASMSDRLPRELIESALLLDKAFGIPESGENLNGGNRILFQAPSARGLLDQLMSFQLGKIERITVVGAFFDSKGELLQELLNRWPKVPIDVGIDPASVWLSKIPQDPRLKLVNADKLAAGHKNRNGYLHAKVVYFQAKSGDSLIVTGSANPSAPAWLSLGLNNNIEAVVTRTGADADRCAKALGLHHLASAHALTPEQLQDVGKRIQKLASSTVVGPQVMVGIASYENSSIVLTTQLPVGFDVIEALGDSDNPVQGVHLAISKNSLIGVTGEMAAIRSLQVRSGESVVARILVHHPELITRRIFGAARESTNALIRQLVADGNEIQRVLPLIEKVIFSDESAATIRLAVTGGDKNKTESNHQRPASLEVSIHELHRPHLTSLFSSGGDLAYLIDVLANHISITDNVPDRGVNEAGLSEEEQIGRDDESAEGVAADVAREKSTDEQVAALVCKRTSKLCARMGKALKQKRENRVSLSVLAVQLLAVMALIQELKHLSQRDRWRRNNLSLVEMDDLQELFDSACEFLFSPDEKCLDELMPDMGDPPQEVRQLLGFLVWLCWESKASWTNMRLHTLSSESSFEDALVNDRILGLLINVGDDSEIWTAAKEHIERTLPPEPVSVIAADRWFSTHRSLSQKVIKFDLSDVPRVAQTICQGDIVTIPGITFRPTIAVACDEKYVTIVGQDQTRKFLSNRAIRLTSF
jgi:hypothetical protein